MHYRDVILGLSKRIRNMKTGTHRNTTEIVVLLNSSLIISAGVGFVIDLQTQRTTVYVIRRPVYNVTTMFPLELIHNAI